MSEPVIYALHGFLGQASDWDFLKPHFKNYQFIAENYFSNDCPKDFIDKRVIELSKSDRKIFFIGYSLGGRIGLNILNLKPELFDHLIFISTNPGIPDDATVQRHQREVWDQNWSEKITANNWENFLKEWNSQAVFQGSKQEPKRDLDNYDLSKVKKILLNWSQSKQPDYTELIKKHKNKITWIVADCDSKYCHIAQDLKSKGALNEFIQISGGHRLWLDNPQALRKTIENIISLNC